MKVYTNQSVIDKNQKLGMRFSIAGLLILGFSFVLIWTQFAPYAWPVLIVGMVVSTVGTYYANRWIRPPLAESVLAESMERLSGRYVLFNHTGIVPHLLLSPKGLIPIKAKRYEGPVQYDAASGKWRGKFSFRRFYGQGLTAETLGNPTEEVGELTAQVQAWLQSTLPDLAERIPVEGVALFLAPKVEMRVEEPPLALAQAETVREIVQDTFARQKPLPREIYKRLRAALEDELPDELKEAA